MNKITRFLFLVSLAICNNLAFATTKVDENPGIDGISRIITLAEPDIELSTNRIDFGVVAIGQTSASQSISITNNGTEDLNFLGTELLDPFSAFRLVTVSCGNALLPGQSCELQFAFSPSLQAAQQSAVFRISTNDPGQSTVEITLSGSLPPDIAVDPTTIDFGNVVQGTTGEVQLTITNEGSGDLNIADISVDDQQLFGVQSNQCVGATLASGESCQITVLFGTVTPGTFTGALTITSNDPDEGSLEVPLVATSLPDIEITPITVDFGEVALDDASSANRTITVSNTGGANLVITDIGLIPNTSDFIPVFSECNGGQLPPGGSCIIVGHSPAVHHLCLKP